MCQRQFNAIFRIISIQDVSNGGMFSVSLLLKFESIDNSFLLNSIKSYLVENVLFCENILLQEDEEEKYSVL